MMKKLLSLMLVLGVATLSSGALAGLILTDEGGTISIGVDEAVKGYEFFITAVDGDVKLDGAGVVFHFNWDFNNVVTIDSDGLWRGGGSQFFGANQGPGTIVSGIGYSGAGWIEVRDAYNASFEPVSVYVPEPMSMLLLGLGGLFLRRRK